MRRTAIYTLLITLVVSSCDPIEPTESEPVTSQGSSKEILELEENTKMDESSVFVPEVTYAPQYTCPNCGELFDGHECENCHYTENR